MLADAFGIKKVILACGRVDLRKGIAGLSVIIGADYDQNPYEKGTLFLFCGQRADRIKGLLWMGTGFLLLYMRLEDGRFSWPRDRKEAAEITEEQFHARRDFSDAIKAIETKNQKLIQNSIAHQALVRIAAIYKLEESYSNLSAEERLKRRKVSSQKLVDEFFAWAKKTLSDKKLLPKGKTAEGLKYCINQEKYLRVFLENGDIPIDNSASERSIRTFCVGKKNWVLIDSARGAEASAIAYSITETAKLNNLNPYYYLEYLFSEIPKYCTWDDKKKSNVISAEADLNHLLPWSTTLPEKCYKPRRK